MRTLAVVLILLAPVFAGCTDGGSPGDEIVGPQDVGEESYRVRVLVIDDEYFPIPKADVYLMELGRNATTDRLGDAFFEDVPPGAWTVHAQQEDHLPNRTRLVVTPEADPEARLTLRDRPPDLYLADFRRAVGMCGIGGHADAGGTVECQDLPLTPPSRTTFVMEADFVWGLFEFEWDAQGPAAERMRFEVGLVGDVPFADGSTRMVVEGESPLQVEIAETDVSAQMKQRGNRIFIQATPAEEPATSGYVAQYFDVFAQLVYFKAGARPDGITTSE